MAQKSFISTVRDALAEKFPQGNVDTAQPGWGVGPNMQGVTVFYFDGQSSYANNGERLYLYAEHLKTKGFHAHAGDYVVTVKRPKSTTPPPTVGGLTKSQRQSMKRVFQADEILSGSGFRLPNEPLQIKVVLGNRLSVSDKPATGFEVYVRTQAGFYFLFTTKEAPPELVAGIQAWLAEHAPGVEFADERNK